MKNYFDKNIIQGISNSNEFKGWLLSRRWFGDKSALSNLEFDVSLQYFEIIAERIFLTIIEVKTTNYSKKYFLPLVYYEKIEAILKSSEKTHSNIVNLTENTFSKKLALTIENEQKIITLNLLEAEFCLFFWKKLLFDADISEKFPSLDLKLTLYNKQFEDEVNMKKVQNLIEAGLYSDRYNFSINQLGKGNTTNILFSLNISNKKTPEQKPISYVLKSFKDYSKSLEPSILFVLVKNKFPNAPKIYGTIKVRDIETIGIIESVPNIGNLGDIFWNELNNMIDTEFKDINIDYSKFNEKSNISKLIKEKCVETIKVTSEIGKYINNLHKSLILPSQIEYNLETVDSETYLKIYTESLNRMISELLSHMTDQPESAFFNLPKISSILIDIKDIIERFRSEFEEQKINIQPVHQDLHMEQILYNKIDNQYNFYFIDFEGDPQLSLEEKKGKFPIEKDLASFLRALSYIKFNTLLRFIEKNIIRKDKYEVPEEILYNLFFRRAARPLKKVLDILLNVLNIWESKLIGKILKNLNADYILITYFYIERALHELNYEILFRPNMIIIPILGLKEIIEKS
ncbi:MAG: hypothetical protein KAW51_04435 [Candidatus Lokiarchaeota archaeon]|nr:hypothetical protein [Candidatus Lokiarchaeota archaeon]